MDAANTSISNDLSETGSTSEIYKNHPLGSNETRVVQIMPSTSTNESDLISLRLSVISLVISHRRHYWTPFGQLPYLAVSYMWGDPSPTKDILVDGGLFAVRLNIWNFLLQMRKEQCEDSLWIDSICINQNDLSERGHQVALMGQVYSKATEVRVWLGAGTEENWLGMQRLSKTDWSAFIQGGCYKQGHSNRERHLLDCSKCDILPPSLSPQEFVAPALRLCELEYWSRMWIVQEYVLAYQLKIQCGAFVIDAKTLDRFLHYHQLRTINTRDPRYPLERPIASGIVALRKIDRSPGSTFDFLRMLNLLHRQQSSDPRDRIYAILSLNQFASENIVPDYTISTLELFSVIVTLFDLYFEIYGGVSRGHIELLQQALQLSDDCDAVRSAWAAAIPAICIYRA